MGGAIRKQFIELGNMPVIAHTVMKFQMTGIVNSIYLVVPPEMVEYCESEIVERYKFTKVAEVVAGGKERQDSVYNGIMRVNPETDIIAVHDGVRPFVSEDIIRESITAADKYGAAVAAIPEKDTVKEVSDELIIGRTLNRKLLWRIQTPQVFRMNILKEAFKRAKNDGYYGTDEASLVERMGYPVRIVKGSDFNIKITIPEELVLGRAILEYQQAKKV
ncbi:MAG: 2-C-methyl-D-erythritol 4-phosphate cytidylyltransferase [Nitrospinae bacterium]|nr:2-C-methyl-D-erythritol 4-phosphate cytidylyltransferase [Nitrospinota bacterium]